MVYAMPSKVKVALLHFLKTCFNPGGGATVTGEVSPPGWSGVRAAASHGLESGEGEAAAIAILV